MISGILASFSRLSIGNVQGPARTFTTNTLPLYFKATPFLCSEPLKKKKKVDPAILKHRFERRKRNLEKHIRKLEKVSKSPKPVLECEIPSEIYTEKKLRIRKLPKISPEVQQERMLLLNEWSSYNLLRFQKDMENFERIQFSQQKALDALQQESEELYQAAIQLDLESIPYEAHGPTLTPPIENFEIVDGDYLDITRKYEGE